MKSNLSIIISREFKERVAKKSFIITTILAPLLMVALMAAPALIMSLSSPSEKTIAVVDNSGVVTPELMKVQQDLQYLTLAINGEPVDSVLTRERYDGVLVIGSDIVDNPGNALLYTHDSGSLELESALSGAIEKAIENQRLKKYNIENMDEILKDVQVDITLRTIKIDENGEEKNVSTTISMILGMIMTFILYMFLLLYGQMVMTSIIEEKNNRVLELMVSSVRPIDLMLGKIIGVGLVALLQIAVWALIICSVSAYVMPLILPETVANEAAMMNAGTLDMASATTDTDMLQAISIFSSVGYIAKLFCYMTLFLIGGFLFYASIFAAIGSSVDNVQDASQLQTFAIMPILLAFAFSMTVANDPNSTLAVWLSMIPFTSPMVTLARLPFDIPEWEVWTSFGILVVSFVLMAWFAGKIYRIGIFMYGKKPNIKELIRWARYK